MIIFNVTKLASEHVPGWHFEIYRGDSFQVLIHEPHLALKVALILKSRLRSLFRPVKGTSVVKSDARIAIGIGTMCMQKSKVIESHGEAFELSGTEPDKIIKESLNLSIKTPLWRCFLFGISDGCYLLEL